MIKILASNSNEKSDLFEDFTKKILDALGFHNFRIDVLKVGRELDIQANHKVTDEPILCECKAYEEKLGGDHLSKFYGVYEHEYKLNKRLKGLFFSLSGFKDALIEYYNEKPKKVQERFKIYSDTDIERFLKDSKIVESVETIEYIVRRKIPYEISQIYLTVSKQGLLWVITFKSFGKETHFSILDGKGEEVSKLICDEISELDNGLNGLELINLQARTKVIRSLSDMAFKKIEDISQEIKESAVDVEMALSNLLGESIALKNLNGKIILSSEFDIFLRLIKEFLSGDADYSFFKSKYVQTNLNERLIKYLESRFHLEFEKEMRYGLYKLLAVSPSALYEALFCPTDFYQTGYEQIKGGGFSDEVVGKSREVGISRLTANLIQKMILDLNDSKTKDILAEKEIKGYKLVLEVKLATLNELYLAIKTDSTMHMAKVKGKIKAGELLSGDANALLEFAAVLTNLGEAQKALEGYQKVIDGFSDPGSLKVAWNNKGLVFANLENYEEAISCYEKALECDSTLKEAHYNKGRALSFLGRFPEAIESYEKAIELDENYEAAKKYLAEAKEKNLQ
ncbi:MAG: tetratricopeptide repeat protein [Halobacteriota archaeon]